MVSRFRAVAAGGVALTVAGLVLFAVFSGIGDTWWIVKDRYIFDRHFGESPVNQDYRGYSAVAWSPDGKWIAAANWVGGIRILDSVSGEVRYSYQDKEEFHSMEWSPHGNELLWGCGDQIMIWDVKKDPNPVVFAHLDNASSVAWSPDGEKIAACNYYSWNYSYMDGNRTHSVILLNCTVFVYTFENGSILFNISIPYLELEYLWPLLEWPKDGSRIIGWFEGDVHVWNASDGNEIRSFSWGGWIPPSLSPDGRWLAFPWGLINIENESYHYLWTIIYENQAAWSHDGKKLAIGNREFLAIYDMTKGKTDSHNPSGLFLDGKYAHNSIVAWSPDDRQILITTQDEGIDIMALDSDSDGIADYRDDLPTVNYKLELLLALCALAVVSWAVAIWYHRISRIEKPRA